MRNVLLATVAASTLAIAASSAVAAGGKWVAGVPVANSTSTAFFGITDKNTVAGDYIDASGVTHGFVGPFSGSAYKSFDDAGGTTQPRAINNTHDITGYDTGTLTPWERNSHGKLQDITKGGKPLNEIAQGINSKGIFVGNYFLKSGASTGYTGQNYKYQAGFTLSLKNSGYAGRGYDTAGDIVGWLYDSSQVQHGFIIKGGKAKQIDYPSAIYTVMEGMNDKGMAVGQYEDASGVIHGFLYNVSTGKSTDLTAPGATLTQAWGINNNNVVAVSASNGPYVYCVSSTGCPSAAPGHIAKQDPAKYVTARP